jgi:hypothetical protein
MTVTMIRAKVKPEHVADLKLAAKKMFAAIDEAQPAGVQYASTVLPDDETFVVLLALDDPENNPLAKLPEFPAYQANIQSWLAGPPTIETLDVVGSYGLF